MKYYFPIFFRAIYKPGSVPELKFYYLLVVILLMCSLQTL